MIFEVVHVFLMIYKYSVYIDVMLLVFFDSYGFEGLPYINDFGGHLQCSRGRRGGISYTAVYAQ